MIEKPILKRLPHWVLTDKHPAFNDIESVTAIEMVARLYAKMEELVNDYNSFIDMLNEEIERFESDTNETIEEFKNCVTKIMNEYIETIDTKINMQDLQITEAIAYMKDNIVSTVKDLIQEAVEEGEFGLVVHYNATDESLMFSIESGETNG